MQVLEFMAVDTPAAATLWRFLFDHDLLTTFKVLHRPSDDLLPLFLANPRALHGWQFDGMWLRPIDIAAVLGARTYEVEGSVKIGVVDQRLPDNTATWALQGGPDGADCLRTQADADLTLSVADLGGAYLGNLGFRRLVRAGRAQEHSPGVAARADAMFATDPAPWCPQEF
jgi:predicted acetyltransferase